MKRSNTLLVTLSAAGLMAFALTGMVKAQAVDPLTQRQIARLMNEALPPLNAVLASDGKLAAPLTMPRLQFLTAAEFRKLPDAETDTLVRARLPELTGKTLERSQEAARVDGASVALARYLPGTNTIAVALPLDERTITSWSTTALPDPPEFAANRVLQLALVTEMVRFHLDRQYGWAERTKKCRDEDERRTLDALVSGRAQQVTEAVADKLGAFAYAALLTQRWRTPPAQSPDPEHHALIQLIVFRQRLAAVTEGKAFFAELRRDGIASPEATAFNDPPRQSLWVARPELYVKALRARTPDLKKVLATLETLPPAPKWAAAQQAMGPDMVREVATMLKEQVRAEAVLRGWEEGRALIWTLPGAAGQAVVSVARFDSPAAARAYHGFSLDLQRKRDELMNANCAGGGCRVLDSQCRTAEMPHSESAVQYLKKIQYGSGPAATANMLYVLAGSLVIEIDGFSTDVDLAWAKRVVDRIAAAFGAPVTSRAVE